MSEAASGSGINAIAELAVQGVATEVVTLNDGRTFMVTHAESDIKEVTNEHGQSVTKPLYINQNVNLQKVDSLVSYVNRFKGPETTIFGDISNNRIDAMLDYHGPGKPEEVVHRAHTQLRVSEEWKLWNSINGKLLGQLDFARFIEENANDVSVPEPGVLLDSVRDIQAHRKVSFIKAVRTASENENFEFAVDNEAKTRGSLELPTKFRLFIPVYFGETGVTVEAFLRWKIDAEAGGLQLGISLNRVEFVRQMEFERIVDEVGGDTDCQCLYGTIG